MDGSTAARCAGESVIGACQSGSMRFSRLRLKCEIHFWQFRPGTDGPAFARAHTLTTGAASNPNPTRKSGQLNHCGSMERSPLIECSVRTRCNESVMKT